MTDYMLLMRNEGNPMANVTDEERNASMAEWGTWMGGLQEQGKLKGGLPFNPAAAAVINSKKEATNTFHSHGNNVNVGGFIHIQAANLAEAVEIAKGCPGLHGADSTVEVREFMEM